MAEEIVAMKEEYRRVRGLILVAGLFVTTWLAMAMHCASEERQMRSEIAKLECECSNPAPAP